MTGRTDRAEDVVHLAWLSLRAAGHSSAAIAAAFGASPAYVRAATNRIRAADLAESGERPDIVAGAYW